MIADNFWSKRACGTESKVLLISKKTEHISVLLLRDCKQSWEKDSKAVRQHAVVDLQWRSPVACQKLDSAHTGG